MISLTAKEVAEAVGLTATRIKQLRESGVIIGELRGNQWFFPPSVIATISNRPETRGRKKKKDTKCK